MTDILKMEASFSKVSINKVLKASLESKKKVLEELQIGQMVTGTNSEGRKIGKYKSVYYAKYKFKISTLAGYGYIDLRLYGDFYSGIVAKVSSSEVVFTSTDSKAKDLEARFHPFGLNSESLSTFSSKFLAPEFNKQFQNELRKV